MCILLQALFQVTHAGSFGVMPTGLRLDTHNNKGIITVSNHGNQKATIQAEILSWIQSYGQNQYMPTQEVWVKPQLLTLLPGKSQVLHVGTRIPSLAKEKAYRLMLTELPLASTEQSDIEDQPKNLTILLQLNLPVYVSPTTLIRLQQWQAQQKANGNIIIKLNNQGNTHVLVNELTLRKPVSGADFSPLAVTQVNDVVFPGHSHYWEITPKFQLFEHPFILEIKTDGGRQSFSLTIPPYNK
ncbi:fimbrial biogenesis chaperone [Acinetobacter sp. Lyrl_1]|uniref:fimbrial biogenesis chaperone n=1 Tax=Acinetobacter sp. Lyrl_1 TaxID=3110920 RepID=UPI003F7C8417